MLETTSGVARDTQAVKEPGTFELVFTVKIAVVDQPAIKAGFYLAMSS